MRAPKRPRCFLIMAPAHWTDVVLEDGSGPTYDEPAVLFVYARSRRRATVLAVRYWRRAMRRRDSRIYLPDAVKDRENPFRGLSCSACDQPEWEPLLEAVA